MQEGYRVQDTSGKWSPLIPDEEVWKLVREGMIKLHTPMEDGEGFQFRAAENPTLAAVFRQIGDNPARLPFRRILTAGGNSSPAKASRGLFVGVFIIVCLIATTAIILAPAPKPTITATLEPVASPTTQTTGYQSIPYTSTSDNVYVEPRDYSRRGGSGRRSHFSRKYGR